MELTISEKLFNISSLGTAIDISFRCVGPKFTWALPVANSICLFRNNEDPKYPYSNPNCLSIFGVNLITLVLRHKGRYSFNTIALLPNVPEQDITISFSFNMKCAYLPCASSFEIIFALETLMILLLMHLIFMNFVPLLLTYCQFLIPGPS